MSELDYEALLSHAGIEKGDVIDVASDMIGIMMFCRKRKLSFSPDSLIDALKELVGKEGTVMIRMFNWDFCKGADFDIRTTPSRVGALGNTALNREDFVRTHHPLYSWMVWGKDRDVLLKMENKAAFGKGTPFDYLYEVRGKQLTVGNTVADACTQMHHCEALCRVPYRYEKEFTGNYTDENGVTSRRTYSMYVRPLNVSVVNTNTNEGERRKTLLDAGILREYFYEDTLECSSILLHEVTDFFCRDIRENEGKFIVSVDGKEGYAEAGIDPLTLDFGI
ncbi:MAG: AAC(3) family N-acetyltransferase [Lachnospiraceae bacterium]|nr:AAC(3) family N-acetyltransferase [Lachnospiraceae bacterium]